MDVDDTEPGGEALSIEEAASVFVKANAQGAEEGQPEGEEPDEDAAADDESTETNDDEIVAEEDEEDGETDDEGQPDEDDEETEPDTERGRFVANDGRVRLPDGEVLTVAELIQGNLRDRDYRQKTMQAADERREFEQQSSAFKAMQQEVEQQRDYVTQLLQSVMPQPPSPTMLDPNSPDYDPLGYTEHKARFDSFTAHQNYLQQQTEQAKQQAAKEQSEQQRQRLDAEWAALQEVMPELRDRDKANTFSQTVVKAAQGFGYSQQEIAETLPYDHRHAVVLDKAAKWDRLQASKSKAKDKLKGKPPVTRGGKRLSPDAKKAQRSADAMKRLKQSGSVEDAAAAYLASTKG